MLDLRSNKKEDSGWIRLIKHKGVLLATLYGDDEIENKLKIKTSDYIFVTIDKSTRDIIRKKPNDFFILDFRKSKQKLKHGK